MIPGLSLQEILAEAGNDPSLQELFGGKDAFKALQDRSRVQGDARRRISQAALDVFNSDAGQIVFEYLVGSYVRAWQNVSAMGLPMETAIQLHAVRDGQVGVVHDLLRLVKEAQAPLTAPNQEA